MRLFSQQRTHLASPMLVHSQGNQSGQSGSHALKARFVGPILGLSGTDRPQVGPMLAPLTLLSGTATSTGRRWPQVCTQVPYRYTGTLGWCCLHAWHVFHFNVHAIQCIIYRYQARDLCENTATSMLYQFLYFFGNTLFLLTLRDISYLLHVCNTYWDYTILQIV